jgi:hypothetical protein
MHFLKPKWAVAWSRLIKERGFKGFIKEKGWKILIVFFLFYLIRDVTLYLIIPYLIVDNIAGC